MIDWCDNSDKVNFPLIGTDNWSYLKRRGCFGIFTIFMVRTWLSHTPKNHFQFCQLLLFFFRTFFYKKWKIIFFPKRLEFDIHERSRWLAPNDNKKYQIHDEARSSFEKLHNWHVIIWTTFFSTKSIATCVQMVPTWLSIKFLKI